MNLREVLRAYLDHRHEVLARRTRHRLEHIEHRLDVLGGYLVAFANLDEVIRIVREKTIRRRCSWLASASMRYRPMRS